MYGVIVTSRPLVTAASSSSEDEESAAVLCIAVKASLVKIPFSTQSCRVEMKSR